MKITNELSVRSGGFREAVPTPLKGTGPDLLDPARAGRAQKRPKPNNFRSGWPLRPLWIRTVSFICNFIARSSARPVTSLPCHRRRVRSTTGTRKPPWVRSRPVVEPNIGVQSASLNRRSLLCPVSQRSPTDHSLSGAARSKCRKLPERLCRLAVMKGIDQAPVKVP